MNIPLTRYALHLRGSTCPAEGIFLRRRASLLLCTLALCWAVIPAEAGENWIIVLLAGAGPAAHYGAERLQSAFSAAGSPAALRESRQFPTASAVVIGLAKNHPLIQPNQLPSEPESFVIRQTSPKQVVAIAGVDDAGILYGCIELADQIQRTGSIPPGFSRTDAPAMRFRIAQIVMTPGGWAAWRRVMPVAKPYYEWFYNRSIWTRVLDTLAENRLNGLCIWTQHVFSSFVRLPEFPEDQEVSDQQLAENHALLRWLNQEARRRSIRIIWQYYAITVSSSFNRAHASELKGPEGLRLAQRYTASWIEHFLTEYPEMDLLATAAEGQFDVSPLSLLRDVIFPTLRRVGQKTGRNPTLFLRMYCLDMETIRAIVPLYQPLYTMWKYNNESMATPEADPSHDPLISISQGHLANIHVVQNLKPFRWGSPDFIRISCQNMLRRGFRGVHFYTMWYDWPYSGDRVTPKLLQVDRDWLWFALWGRYTWNPNRPREEERAYWTERLERRFGVPRKAARQLLSAYTQAGWVAPNLTKEFWLGTATELPDMWKYDGDRTIIDPGNGGDSHCLAEGPRLDQMVHAPGIHGYSTDNSTPPLSQTLMTIKQYADRLAKGEDVRGLTPVEAAVTEQTRAQSALEAARAAVPLATREQEEARRFLQDLEMIKWMADVYSAKAEAAVWLRVWVAKKALFHTNDGAARDKCLNALRRSLDSYRQLAKAGDKAYFSVTDFPRNNPYRVPIAHWSDVLTKFEDELRTVEAQFSLEGK